jgi:Flp pilus assembly protein TadG
MANLARRMYRTLSGETSGAEIAEAAAVLPLMFMVLLGIFWFGQAFSIYGTITRAAQEGARAAVAPACATCAAGTDPSTAAYTAVQNVMQTAHLDPNQMQPPATTPTLQQCIVRGAAACDSSYPNICIQGVTHSGQQQVLQENLVQLSPSAGSGNVCGIAVSFQYPFKFWLPFTSLNKQQILLTAHAEVRAESQ